MRQRVHRQATRIPSEKVLTRADPEGVPVLSELPATLGRTREP
jgi:hypothetical protein